MRWEGSIGGICRQGVVMWFSFLVIKLFEDAPSWTQKRFCMGAISRRPLRQGSLLLFHYLYTFQRLPATLVATKKIE